MKKFMLIVLAAALTIGVVFLGFVIFGASNVKEIELVGNMQQIYFVGDDISYGDAKLKVTYQNGSSKLIEPNGNLKVSLFSTSGHGKYHGTMKLTYKSQTIEVDYSVLDRTSYIVASEKKKTATTTTTLYNSTKRIIDFGEGGSLRYFEIKSGEYFMHDGSYDRLYYYEIIGDTIYAHLGDENVYEITTHVDGNELLISAITKHYSNANPEIVDYHIETKFTTTNLIKTNNTSEKKTDLVIKTDKCKFDIDTSGNNYWIVEIPKNKTIDDSGLYLRVDYDNGEIYYVYITQSMLVGNFNECLDNESFNISGFYESRKFTLFYRLI